MLLWKRLLLHSHELQQWEWQTDSLESIMIYDLQCDTDFVNRRYDARRWSVMLSKQRKSRFDINDWLSWQILIELWRYISYFHYELIYSSRRTFSV